MSIAPNDTPPVVDGPLDLDDYAVTPEQVSWIAETPVEELGKRLDELDYAWNMYGQEDERERAFMRAIEDRMDVLDAEAVTS